jgi:hypothetical protein
MEFFPMFQEVAGLDGKLQQYYLPLLGCRICGQARADYILKFYAGPTSEKIIDVPMRLTRHMADVPARGAATCTVCREVRTWGHAANKHYAVTANGKHTYGIQPKAEAGKQRAEYVVRSAESGRLPDPKSEMQLRRKNFSTRWDVDRVPVPPATRCRWCAQGYVAIESSVRPGIGMMVHPETPIGRIRCGDSPALQEAAHA